MRAASALRVCPGGKRPMLKRTRQEQQLARAIAAARSFLAEAAPVYSRRSSPLGDRLRSASEVAGFVREQRPDLTHAPQEHFLAISLDSKHRPNRVIEVALGTLASVDVHPREAFRELIVSASAAVIFVHNHPSGSAEPSADDLELTARLRDVGQLVGISVLDHIVIAAEGHVSLADRGLL